MKDNIAIITGGAGHLGIEVAHQLARKGVHLFVIDKNKTAAVELCNVICSEYAVRCVSTSCDLLDPNTFENILDEFTKDYSTLDYLVNIAAFYDDVPGWGCDFENEGYGAWNKVMGVNVMAPFFLAQKFSSLLKQSEQGAIVNVSSIYGIIGPDHRLYDDTDMTNPCSYSVSKAGLNQLSKWLSTVLAPKVRVNTVSPGGIARRQNEIFSRRYNAKVPLQRMCTEKEVANAILFLLSSSSSYITGHNLVVDGGWTAW